MGDPSGIGPEVICRAIQALPERRRAAVRVVGDRGFLERARELVDGRFQFARGNPPAAGEVALVEVSYPGRDSVRDGEVSPGGGACAFACVRRALSIAESGEIDVIVTAPLNKEALHLAGHHYDGHTGMLRELTGSPRVFMLLASNQLSCIHVSTHVAMSEAVRECTRDRVLETIRAGWRHLLALGLAAPRIAVAGLNPHAGEAGLFGAEETREIAPAVARARTEGMSVTGPLPGDTVFLRAMRGEFDLVVGQYHDQGHIPIKLVAFDEAVNVTLGLPILRTSVDHGTAFDIAWRGEARADNMLAALSYAERLVLVRQGERRAR